MAKPSGLWGACAAVFLVGCSFSASCGSHKIDGSKAQSFITEKLTDTFGVAPTGVSCPDDIPTKKDTSFRCTAGFSGNVSATITLTQTDDNGFVVITQVDGVQGAKPIETAITEGIAKQMKQAVTADCGAKVRAVHKGESFECKMTVKSGEIVPVAITFTDEHGGYDWNLAPAAPKAPPTE
ncbi:hypothetical protein BH11MYX2_BH11MYX2_11670 [soil metagenome]